jgi:hypothetical protein
MPHVAWFASCWGLLHFEVNQFKPFLIVLLAPLVNRLRLSLVTSLAISLAISLVVFLVASPAISRVARYIARIAVKDRHHFFVDLSVEHGLGFNAKVGA